ncbi:hypothetical protein ACHHYP_04553 [Achlya hypogyna]|uniref:Uncharacterized protein n=1 Tax=Achlya hypogyna TaxID=1202772 RepID=A0A1V9Z0U3_ACHHY|nr:hypothetical protein ACHHYP_04553 [Achlya hypogyna]
MGGRMECFLLPDGTDIGARMTGATDVVGDALQAIPDLTAFRDEAMALQRDVEIYRQRYRSVCRILFHDEEDVDDEDDGWSDARGE